jgi:UDP-N-acetylglucosamine 2-epimerase (non-hydrolysing)
MKIMTVVGARPNFMKAAPLITAVRERNSEVANGRFAPHEQAQREEIHHVLVHTGQHYDDLMSGSFFADLQIPKPDIHLGVGSASHAAQTAEIMSKFETVLLQERTDVIIVVGDVNSTLACALVAAKISFANAVQRQGEPCQPREIQWQWRLRRRSEPVVALTF